MLSLPREARGPFVYTMLDGDALFAVEDLDFSIFFVFPIMEARFSGEDSVDQTEKSLVDVFQGVGL